MDKYTCKNLIIDPETQGLEDIIGKEVYANDVPLYCLKCANKNLQVSILREIRKNDFFPFRVEDPDGRILGFDCIVPKREEPKPEFIPFTSAEEFIEAYRSIETEKLRDETAYLAKHGMWLRQKCDSEDSMILSISPDGVFVLDTFYTWELLIKDFLFLDGSPCGRLKENK